MIVAALPWPSTVAALYVDPKGPYVGELGVEAWALPMDARTYAGPHPVVAHPPCQRWGRLWWSAKVAARKFGGDESKAPGLGEDGGCFAAALRAVETFGGVLEHPEASLAWKHFDLERPKFGEGWRECWRTTARTPWSDFSGWVCSVDQGRYGHRARKRTWLLYVGRHAPPELDWGVAKTTAFVCSGPDGYRTSAFRAAKGVELMGKLERRLTPPRFKDVLLGLARLSRAHDEDEALGGVRWTG